MSDTDSQEAEHFLLGLDKSSKLLGSGYGLIADLFISCTMWTLL